MTGSAMFDLSGKVAVVTGGASGIGLATARRFREAGAKVTILDVADATEAADAMGAEYIQTDVSVEEQVCEALAEVARRHGRIDVLVNNAGIGEGEGTIQEQAPEAYRHQFEVNVLGPVYGTKHVVDHMPPGGSIINMASMAGVIGFPGFASYGASKWALVGVTKTAALELAPRGIRVNAVCPTGVDTPMMDDVDPSLDDEVAVIEAIQPFGRLATAEEIAAAVHFLVADDCAMITGHALHVDGGLVAGPSIGAIELALEQRARGDQETTP